MRTVIILVLLGAGVIGAQAQTSDNTQREINEQVWKPFIRYFNARDQKHFAQVHSKDVARVQQDANRILGAAEYFKEPSEADKKRLANQTVSLELRFIQRIANDTKAFEVGYYKTTVTNTTTGSSRSSYGKFHVLLVKENDTWKILMDADAHENTDEAVFLTGKPME
ncbi:MAG TPA: hypothetical protein VG737_11945 [Cyclobacteriaceae bacterium]|nr:hypothetical protein [Cyclobacteriaceae bacterium]